MTIEFELTEQDASEFIRMSLGLWLLRPAPMLACWAGPSACLAGLGMLAASHSAHWLWVGILPAFWLIVFAHAFWKGRRRTLEHVLARQGRCGIELLPDAVIVRHPHLTTRYPWTTFRAWRETRNLVALTSPELVLPIPRRALATEQQLEGFRSDVQRYLAAAAEPIPGRS